MRQKLLTLNADYTVKDATGRDVFFIAGKTFTTHDQMAFQDMQGNELCVIRKKLLQWGPTYEIYHAGQLEAVVKESLFTLLGHRFTVDDQFGPDDLEVKGNFTDHQYAFTRGGQTVASVSESWFTIADTYGVDIADGQDDVLILACTVVIDRCEQAARHREGAGRWGNV
ncbi:MAG TPA: LURP-one-related family protein [Tepidisphaeraceae bacterium]|nr:LURP-one-related family protein [Tepidisphaeraceae bacterium]